MAAEVKIVTDSSSYLEPDVIKRYDINIVPIKVAFGSEVFREGVDITNDEFYRRVLGSNAFPTTSQPSAGDFVSVYGRLVEQGHPILSIHISHKMSGVVNAALSAKNTFPDAQIEVMDSQNLVMGMLVIPAAEAARKGQSLQDIKAATEKMDARIRTVGMFETLKYAWKGGRISGLKALAGTVLRIKPVLTMENGEVKVIYKPRTHAAAIEYMVNFVERHAGKKAKLHGWMGHGRTPETARLLERELRSRLEWAELRVLELGPTYGTHMGPGFIGLGFYGE